jgi:arginase
MINQIELIGASIDACSGIKGSKDTPYIINNILQTEMLLKFKNIIAYRHKTQNIELLELYYTELANSLLNSLNNHKIPCVIGGDHSCAIATWSAISYKLSNEKEELGLLWFDAHMDAHTPITTPSNNIHGMPVATLLGYGHKQFTQLLNNKPKIKPENIILIGVRSFESAEQELLTKLGVKIYYQKDVIFHGLNKIIHDSYNYLQHKVDKIGFSIDVDGFDPIFTPGVGTTVKNGINLLEFLNIIQTLDLKKMIAFEITEGNQILDIENKTICAIIKIIETFIIKIKKNEL